MSTDLTVILERQLLLGSKIAAASLPSLRKHGVTHVLNMATEVENFHQSSFTYLRMNLRDEEDEDILASFPVTTAFIRDALRESNSNVVFVHCQAGISRSASAVIAFLMMERAMSLRDAFLYTLARRPNIGPNRAFFDSLIRLEYQLRPAELQHQPPTFSVVDYYVESLAQMGFAHDVARKAVVNSAGRFELAVQLCLAGPSEANLQ